MFRKITIDKQDGWPLIKQAFCDANTNTETVKKIVPVGNIVSSLSANGVRYRTNSYVKVKLENDNRPNPATINLHYSRVNLKIFFRGMKINKGDLTSITPEGIIEYFNKSSIFLEKNCDITIKDNYVTITAKPESYVFYDVGVVKLIDGKIPLSSLIKHDTITFAPNGAIWIDEKLDSLSLVKTNHHVNDLVYATASLAFGRKENDIGYYIGFNDMQAITVLFQRANIGKKLKTVVNESGNASFYINAIITFLSLVHNGYSYGWIENEEDENKPENKDITINLAECKILYAGVNEPKYAGEYYRPLKQSVPGMTTQDYYHVLALEPDDKFRKVFNLRYLTICI